jgi:hypothetical protein
MERGFSVRNIYAQSTLNHTFCVLWGYTLYTLQMSRGYIHKQMRTAHTQEHTHTQHTITHTYSYITLETHSHTESDKWRGTSNLRGGRRKTRYKVYYHIHLLYRLSGKEMLKWETAEVISEDNDNMTSHINRTISSGYICNQYDFKTLHSWQLSQ